MQNNIQIWPSLLAGNFGKLEESAVKAQTSGADALHLDIMDGNFVRNLSMGPDVVKMARRCLKIPLNVHLMLTNPDHFIQAFVEAGASTITIHVEARCDITSALRLIRKLGVRCGVVLNPETPFEALLPFVEEIDEVLCMTVHPGFGGQKFMAEVLPKVKAIRTWLRAHPPKQGVGDGMAKFDLSIDGGIDLKTAPLAAAAGANMLVAGSALYASGDMTRDINAMRNSAKTVFAQALAEN